MSEVFACPHCGEAFARVTHRDLHVGRAHPYAMTAEERAAFEATWAAEEAWFQRLRKHVRSGLVVLPVFAFYVFVVVLLFEAYGNPAFAVMLFPGFAAFSALLYAMMFSRLSMKEGARR